ncbi:uncharacterized protein LOC135463136 [Liolophura sinensis]|uniref:uncharacterized protein LOC135463136 n=1 Tax=Liolophura sinensis TaxID=3198878 RepID=UPI003158264C
MEKKDEEKGMSSNIVLGCHGNTGGARPKVVKQPENSQSTGSATDARLKAQQVAEKLRRKYCQSDEDTKPRQRETKPPRSPVLCARRRRARASALPLCQSFQSQALEPDLCKESGDRVCESVCLPEDNVKPDPSDLRKGQGCQRSDREESGRGRLNCSSRGHGRCDLGNKGHGRSECDSSGGQICRKRSNCTRQKGVGKGRSKFDRWKSRGLSSNWTIRTLADKETTGECGTNSRTLTHHGSTLCGSDCGSTSGTCFSQFNTTKNNDEISKPEVSNELVECCDRNVCDSEKISSHSEGRANEVSAENAGCRTNNEPGHGTSFVSLPSMTSSGSDAILADQSSVTETSDSAVDGVEGNSDILWPTDRSALGAKSAESVSQDKVCLCLTPRISKTGCPRKACHHSWCMACCLPLTPCQFCSGRTLPSLRSLHQGLALRAMRDGQPTHDAYETQCVLLDDSASRSSSRQQIVNLPLRAPVTLAKQSSSDSEQAQDAGASQIISATQPPTHKHKRKRLTYSKERDVAGPLLEDEDCLCTAGQSLITEGTQDDSDEWQTLSSEDQSCVGENDDRLDSLLNSLLISLHHYSDHDLFMDYLSLNIPAEYNWSAGADNSVVDKEDIDYGEEGEIRDLISDSSTLHQRLSDTEATDGEDGGLSSFVDDSGEESGDADDEFECDCPHCQCLSVDADLDLHHHGNINEENGEQLLLESLLSGLREEIAVWEITNSVRVQLLTAMFEFLTSFHGDAPPPATEEAIASIPRLAVDDSHIDQELCCAVCLSRCELGDHLSRLPCSHLFHPPCIGAWLSKSATCPVCRQAL